ncbi:hypothetical protein HY405_00360 [Candidatus Microgenomates bacterium]|nr:hypothetical protein [Candidatus Microgenomates bacterium]
MDKKDAELISFCLHNNPLNQSPYFRKRLMAVKTLLEKEFVNLRGTENNLVFQFEASFKGLAKEYLEYIEKFMLALFNKNKIRLLEKGNFKKSNPLIPVGIRFKDNSATLIVFNDNPEDTLGIDLEKLQGISITNSQFHDPPRRVLENQNLRIRF